jgi:hypothetical protein
MPKNIVSDPITDQESAFARQVLSGGMTDRQAAEAVGLNPDSAAYTKSKPRVRAYMLQHRAAVEQQLVQQEADGLHRLKLDRDQVLDRLWEIANLSPEMTRNSVAGQVKAITLIIAMESFIPDRRARRPSRHLFGEEIRPCAHPAYRCLACPASRQNHRPAAKPCPYPGPRTVCPPVHFCAGLGSGFLHKKDPLEPLCPPPLTN